jgi:glycosyltransferase involved in cell wall biosynthesis
MKISIIIPTRNEADNIFKILSEIELNVHEIIVVDGNSTDETLLNAGRHPKNPIIVSQKSKGKGAALSLGFKVSTGDVVIAVDADGSNDPKELQSFINQIQLGADLVKGSRNLFGGGSEDITQFRNLGNLFLTTIANLVFKTKWTDLAYGYFAIRKELLNKMNVSEYDSKSGFWLSYGQGFEIESLICCRAARVGGKIIEIPSFERNRWSGSSNLKSIPDGLRALFAILYEKIKSISN